MLQKSLTALFALSLAFTACKKKDEAQPQQPTVAVADDNGLIEKFSFDGDLKATRRDMSFSVSGTTAPSATANDRKGNANKALLVPDGSALYIDNLPLPTGDASRTLACWVHLNGNINNARYFSAYGSPEAGKAFGLSFDLASGNQPTSIGGYTWGGSGNDPRYTYSGSTSTGLCGWLHMALTYDKSANKLKFYMNGTLVKEITPYNATNTTEKTPLRIGITPTSGTSEAGSNPKQFSLDDLVIYNRALTATEITALASENAPNCM